MHMSEHYKEFKTSEILTLAQEAIENEVDSYLCNALYSISWDTANTTTEKKASALLRRIRRAMGAVCNSGVEYWLIQKGYATPEQTTDQAMKEYRLAWIKELIQEYQSKGD
jgi:hypothetical protein